MRTTKAQLEGMVNIINNRYGHKLDLDYAYGGVRVCSGNGSRDESPRGTRGETMNWLSGYLQALDNAQDKRFMKGN